MLKIEKKTLPVEIYGTEHKLRYPTCAEQDQLQADLDAAEGDNTKLMRIMRAYLEALGLPVEVYPILAAADFTELIAYVNNPKKK